ncbi:MAG: hypothetical protein A2909_00900 [Candidatus Tagabacteria bacterium RIFCSPLOWO2_01_FULL_39_11]|uniref:ABC transporter ATP-binding protein n=1 Tax=Candidatus Tagabacteria bacterium RIFCSPLOWO2_01_FULL_39_11 TaxID=1802295 RepID=A0A1G2LQE6_9BACT|nr:MAG: hypothetical protein A2909_00900 [Candidatus Tagabacteria bacterium RIFCSPLOWO2_01_FULL_39_11]
MSASAGNSFLFLGVIFRMVNKKYEFLELFRLLKASFGQYKSQIAIMAVLTFFSGILEGFGINAIIPLLSFADKNNVPADDVISRAIESFFIYSNINFTIQYLLIFILLLFFIKAILLFISQYITNVIIGDYQKKTRLELLKLTFAGDWSYLSKQKVGHLDQILVANVKDSSALLAHISSSFLIAVNIAIYSLLVVNVSFWVAVLAIVFGGAILFLFKPLFNKTRSLSHQMVQRSKDLAHYVNENIIGMKSIKSMFAGERALRKGESYFDDIKNLQIKIGELGSFNTAMLQPVGILFIIGVFAFFYKSGAFNLGSFAVAVYAINRVFAGIQAAQSEVYVWNSLIPSLASVLAYREEAAGNKETDSGRKNFSFRQSLEFKDVGFDYGGQKEILSHNNFYIKKGELLGLVGSSGAGKTTIVDLLLRLFKPKSGVILLDGEDASDISLREWRTNIGYVSQDVFLTNDTILNNIKFYDPAINKEDIIEAAKMANIYEFIKNLPQQFETVVGERGTRLSGGEKQRIALARVLARKPEILVLDEATSALDNESEALIQKAIADLRGKITVFAIAHRLSTVREFDRILVLDRSRIVESGAPQELLQQPQSYFYQMYNLNKNP